MAKTILCISPKVLAGTDQHKMKKQWPGLFFFFPLMGILYRYRYNDQNFNLQFHSKRKEAAFRNTWLVMRTRVYDYLEEIFYYSMLMFQRMNVGKREGK